MTHLYLHFRKGRLNMRSARKFMQQVELMRVGALDEHGVIKHRNQRLTLKTSAS